MIGQQISHYSIVAKLGEGGMGEVYLAEDLALKRCVALKVLPADVAVDPERLARFRREAEALAALNHPNIVTVFSIESVDDLHIITMERVEGRRLDELLVEGGLPLDEVLDIGIALARALAAAQAKGITHRDIKPANVMLTADGHLKVLDFGLAKLRRDDQGQLADPDAFVTREQSIFGTVPYMSPEQIEGGDLDGRSDLFSCGIVLYELVTGRRPFPGDSLPKVMAAILETTPVPVRSLRKDLPPELDRILGRCLQKDPAERTQSAAELEGELRALRESAQVVSRAPWTRWALAAGAVALLVVFFSLFGGSPGRSSGRVSGIVVLPFTNGGDPKDDWFATAMTRGVAERLGMIEGLVVRRLPTRWAEKTPQEIGETLDVEYLLFADVFLVDDAGTRRVLVTPELSRANDASLIPLSSYDRGLPGNADILAVQRDIADTVAERVGARLSDVQPAGASPPPTEDTEAYTLYLQGLHFFGRRDEEGLTKALECFEEAAALDPDFALAQAGINMIPGALTWYGLADPASMRRRIKTDTERMMANYPELPQAWTAHAAWLQEYELDSEGSARAFLEAIDRCEQYPLQAPSAHQWYSYPLSWSGRHEEALQHVMIARRLDPTSPIITTWVGLVHYYAGRFDEALDWMDQALELDPDYVPTYWHRTWVAGAAGHGELALASATRLRELAPTNPTFLVNLAYASAAAGQTDETRWLLDEIDEIARSRYVSDYQLAAVYVALDDADGAFELLRRAFEGQATWRGALRVDQRFRPLYDDPRFAELLESVGLARLKE